jgi:hypothetical protein
MVDFGFPQKRLVSWKDEPVPDDVLKSVAQKNNWCSHLLTYARKNMRVRTFYYCVIRRPRLHRFFAEQYAGARFVWSGRIWKSLMDAQVHHFSETDVIFVEWGGR